MYSSWSLNHSANQPRDLASRKSSDASTSRGHNFKVRCGGNLSPHTVTVPIPYVLPYFAFKFQVRTQSESQRHVAHSRRHKPFQGASGTRCMSSFAGGTVIEQLVEQVKAKGGAIHGVTFTATAEDGVGIYATSAHMKGETLLSIPFSICLSVDAVLASEMRVVIEDTPSLMNHPDEILCLGIMYALAHPSSSWSSHVATFPKHYNSCINWSDDELQLLAPCSVFHLSKMIKKQLVADWTSLHEPLKLKFPSLLAAATLDTYVWAMSAVYSRAVGVYRRNKYERFIPPILDMANHSPFVATEAADTFHYHADEDSIRLVSAEDTQAGDQCLAVYGQYPNSKLALNYGFVVPCNPQRRIDLWTKLSPSVCCFEEKQRIVSENPLIAVQTYDFEGTLVDGRVTDRLMQLVRTIQLTAEELPVADKVAEAISPRNERASLTSLSALLRARLGDESAYQVMSERACFDGTYV